MARQATALTVPKIELPPLAVEHHKALSATLVGPKWGEQGRMLFDSMNEALGFRKLPAWPADAKQAAKWATKHGKKVVVGRWQREITPPRDDRNALAADFWHTREGIHHDFLSFKQSDDGNFYLRMPFSAGVFWNNARAAEVLLDFQRLLVTSPTTFDV